MTPIRFFSITLVLISFFGDIWLLSKKIEMIPERAEISDYNSKYVDDTPTVSVRRSSRGGKYVVRLAGHNKHVWANNVSLFIYFHEYLHNEYRRSFVEASYKLCDFVNKDPYGRLILNYGVVCPLPIRDWDIQNATISFPSFPLFPFTKCKAEVVLKRMVPTEEFIGRGFLYLKIQQ